MKEQYVSEINDILEVLGENLDISKTQYEQAVKSYEAVGSFLSNAESNLAVYQPEILPQGSFLLGTVVRPICDDDDIDVDLVCQLKKKPSNWTQKHLKKAVGDRLKESLRYSRMIKEQDGGRRCWTLHYSDDANYHMDILPALAENDLEEFLNERFSLEDNEDLRKGEIRITDDQSSNYSWDTNYSNWHKSNPFGYARWFYSKSITESNKMFSLNESIEPITEYSEKKSPLHRVVQLLKRHRDIMFTDDQLDSDDRPISIIITTLAARAYADNKTTNISEAFFDVAKRLRNYISEIEDENGKKIKCVPNPVNKAENFADKWPEVKQKEEYFYLWLDKLEKDVDDLRYGGGRGMSSLNESLSKMFGNNVSRKSFSDYGNSKRILREQGKRMMAAGSGILGSTGTKIKNHNFYGDN